MSQDDVDFHVTYHSGLSMDLVQHGAQGDNHRKFFSCIYITTWTITSHVDFSQLSKFCRIVQADDENLDFDIEESECERIFEGVDLIVVYLGTFRGQLSPINNSGGDELVKNWFAAAWLIVEEHKPGLYRRVGTGSVF